MLALHIILIIIAAICFFWAGIREGLVLPYSSAGTLVTFAWRRIHWGWLGMGILTLEMFNYYLPVLRVISSL